MTLTDIYVSSLLHDIGKYIHKYNGGKGKHNILSQLFILKHPEIVPGCDVSYIASLVGKHHDDMLLPEIGTVLSPYDRMDEDLMALFTSCPDTDPSILRRADSLAASSDRASELEGGKGGRAPLAPLISVIGKAMDKRLALRHGQEYRVYEYQGESEKETDLKNGNDPNYKEAIEKSYYGFMKEMESVKDVDSLDLLLKTYWSTVNANTWKPEGQTLGNTTTSLYDHSKMTAAIAACLYLDDSADIDLCHIRYHGNHEDLFLLMKDELSSFGLMNPNIICCTDTESYVMIPDKIQFDFCRGLRKQSERLFSSFGETIDYDIAPSWQFNGCRDDISSRFTLHHTGVMDVIRNVTPTLEPDEKEYMQKHLKDKVITGYSVNNYQSILTYVVSQNDSISKLSTALRVFEMFAGDVKSYLEEKGYDIFSLSFSSCVFALPFDDMYKTQEAIWNIYKRYVSDCTGLSFTHEEYNRYTDTIKHVEQKLLRLSLCSDAFTSTFIHGKRYKVTGLKKYYEIIQEASGVSKTAIYKVLACYEQALPYRKDKDPSHLIAVSRMAYLLSKDIDKADKAFIKKAKEALYSSETKSIGVMAPLWYEAMYQAARIKSEKEV